MTATAQAIGIMGGTFDPVHYGHLRSALECATAFGLDEVRLMPCHPVHRDKPKASASDRLAMLGMAVRGCARLSVENYELQQPHPTYSIDTLRHIRRVIGDSLPLYFIVGTDAMNAIDTWKEWESLFGLVNFIVMHRPGYACQFPHAVVRERLASFDGCHQPSGAIYTLEITALGISSTLIRQLVSAGKPLDFLLPPEVEAYIHEKRLYQ